MTTGYCDTTLI